MAIPKQVVDWFRPVFADANRDTCERIYLVPQSRTSTQLSCRT